MMSSPTQDILGYLEKLERPYSLRVLYLLKNHGSMDVSTIVKLLGVKSRMGVTSCLDALLKLGLVKEEVLDEFPFRRSIKLTERGKVMAEKLTEG